MPRVEPRPSRLLVVMPNWVGDAVMATPALRVLRELLPGAFIGALVRPGIDEILAGSRYFDEVHVARPVGVMGPKRVAAKLRPRRYEHAILLTNSFSTALITRVAGISSRIGYDRDGRGFLLTDKLDPPRRRDTPPYSRSQTDPGAWAPVPACDYYYALVRHTLTRFGQKPGSMGPLELAVTAEQRIAASDVLSHAGVDRTKSDAKQLVLLNPGGNKDEKRWPADRFGALASFLHKHHGLVPLINGSPKEAELVAEVAKHAGGGTPCVELPKHGMTLSTLKGVVERCRLMVTNDTGPRHIAAALGVPVVSLFGPTDQRWTTIPFKDEIELAADPSLPEEEVANDHPERCDVRNIGLGTVTRAATDLLRR